jgi:hypothetical protein
MGKNHKYLSQNSVSANDIRSRHLLNMLQESNRLIAAFQVGVSEIKSKHTDIRLFAWTRLCACVNSRLLQNAIVTTVVHNRKL